MKLVKIDLKLKIKENQEFSYHKSSLMQGVLMEWLDPFYVEQLHMGGFNPYSQHLEKRDGDWHWIICLFDEQAYEEIYSKVMEQNTIYLRHDKEQIDIVEKTVTCEEIEKLLNQYYFQTSPKSISIRFKTPTAFKQRGNYVFYPDIRCILQSMMLKYDSVTVREGTVQEEILEELVNGTKILQYNLKSCSFQMEGIRIPAFIGEMKLGFRGAQTMVNYLQFLFRFACYSGIGIKTSVGMGAIEIQEKNQ